MNAAEARELALALPGATEQPHFHFNSFRIGGKIFATMPPSNDLLHVFVPEAERLAAVAAFPDICEALHWGKRTVGIKIDLTAASRELVEDLLHSAWAEKSGAAP
jgi:predicted DNA-binding protein (MmcQ/YjbR family)